MQKADTKRERDWMGPYPEIERGDGGEEKTARRAQARITLRLDRSEVAERVGRKPGQRRRSGGGGGAHCGGRGRNCRH